MILIWATLLLFVRSSSAKGSNADPGACVEKRSNERNGFSISLDKGNFTAQAGLCVVLPCSFTTDPGFTPRNMVWFKCKTQKQNLNESDMIFHTNKSKPVRPEFEGRVSLLEPDVMRKNCSIIINDLTVSDSGSYQFKVWGDLNGNDYGCKFTQKATISVKDLIQKPTVVIPSLTEGQKATLSCTAPSLCSGSAPNITWTWRARGGNVSHITGNITDFQTENVTAVTQRHNSTLTFNPSAEHHGSTVTCQVNFTGDRTTQETVTLNVTYVKKPTITGHTVVKVGHDLNLTCRVESFPSSVITWTKNGSSQILQKETIMQSDSGTASLVITNMTTEDYSQYICTAKHQLNNLSTQADVIMGSPSRILNGSGCEVQSDVLTCVCISEGVPLPNLTFLLLDTHKRYSEINNTVSVTLSVQAHNDTTTQCVSRNVIGEAKQNLTIKPKHDDPDLFKELLLIVKQPQVIISFLAGILLSATICCLTSVCCRKKQKSYEDMDETLEMVPTQVIPLIDADQSVENDETRNEMAAEAEPEAAGQSVPACDVEPKEAEYSDIDFSKCKKKDFTWAEDVQETTETEYAEIKKEEREETQENGGEDGQMLEGEEVEVMMTEGQETKPCRSAEEDEGGNGAVYSSVDEIMKGI